MFTHVAHFDRKVGIYIATKLCQFASRKKPYAILAGPDGFFRLCSRYRVRPSYGDFLNSFAIKARAGPYGSYDKEDLTQRSTLREPLLSLDKSVKDCIGDSLFYCVSTVSHGRRITTLIISYSSAGLYIEHNTWTR